ncbi:GDYXXLXY domain-containing protein [Hymenobacter saemangeumensis]
MNSPFPTTHPATPGSRQQLRFRWLVGAQALVLLGIAGLAWAADHWGQTIRLRTRPVDPRNILYGDYVRLNYDISRLDTSLWRGPGRVPDRGRRVWVLLRRASPAWQAAGVYGEAPATTADQVALPAQVENSWRGISLRYGLERYYIPEGSGQRLEKAAADSAGLLVRVQVASWGTVRLQGVELK